jgi:ribosomal protein L16 Arg81 hydroxylase
MMRTMRSMAVVMLLACTWGSATAQRPDAPGAERRAQLEQRFQAQMASMLRERLALTDDQLQRLMETNARFERRRRDLVTQERQLRMSLRRELQRGDNADQQRIAQVIEQTIQVQRGRLQLLEEEQRELSTFLSPRQRAMFLGMQEQVRQRAEEMRRQRFQGGRQGAPMRRPPGGGD